MIEIYMSSIKTKITFFLTNMYLIANQPFEGLQPLEGFLNGHFNILPRKQWKLFYEFLNRFFGL